MQQAVIRQSAPQWAQCLRAPYLGITAVSHGLSVWRICVRGTTTSNRCRCSAPIATAKRRLALPVCHPQRPAYASECALCSFQLSAQRGGRTASLITSRFLEVRSSQGSRCSASVHPAAVSAAHGWWMIRQISRAQIAPHRRGKALPLWPVDSDMRRSLCSWQEIAGGDECSGRGPRQKHDGQHCGAQRADDSARALWRSAPTGSIQGGGDCMALPRSKMPSRPVSQTT